jgi:hypothetical protein
MSASTRCGAWLFIGVGAMSLVASCDSVLGIQEYGADAAAEAGSSQPCRMEAGSPLCAPALQDAGNDTGHPGPSDAGGDADASQDAGNQSGVLDRTFGGRAL